MKVPELVRMPNERRDVALRIENVLPIPPCCPVSGNPLEGSTLTIRYRPAEWVLEVYALKQYLQLYVGGHPDGTRNMEQMVAKIAADCAAVLGVTVFVYAHLLLAPEQQMFIRATGKPPCVSTLGLIVLTGSG